MVYKLLVLDKNILWHPIDFIRFGFMAYWLFYRDRPTNVNRSDYSFALEKLHPGTVGNDDALFRR